MRRHDSFGVTESYKHDWDAAKHDRAERAACSSVAFRSVLIRFGDFILLILHIFLQLVDRLQDSFQLMMQKT